MRKVKFLPLSFAVLAFLCAMGFPLMAAEELPAALASASPDDQILVSPKVLEGPVCVVSYSGPIHPIAAEIMMRAMDKAAEQGASLLIIELDTPGGLMSSMQDIKKAILASPVPVAVFVGPKGAQAASAGFFILMAADVAAMAPGTSSGAAHPVNLGTGEEKDEVMGKKILNAAVSEMRSVAERRGRNPDLAVEAVQGDIKSFTAEEALDKKLIDLTADDVRDLVAKLDGREIKRFTGETVVLKPEKGNIVEFPFTLRERILGTIADPNILFILLGLGMLGLYVEISHPGLIFPGVVGAISLILALFATQVLPVNYAGVLLILLAFGLFIAEIKVVSYGLLTTGGVISLILGGMLLIKDPVPGIEVNMSTLVFVAVGIGLAAALVLYFVTKAHRNRPETGEEGMVGKTGTAVTDVHESGKVFLMGERWNAVSDELIEKDSKITVVEVRGMVLKVRRFAR